MSGGPDMPPVTGTGGSGGHAVAVPDSDAPRASAAKPDKPVPAVTPGILSDAELGNLRQDFDSLTDSLSYLTKVANKAEKYPGGHLYSPQLSDPRGEVDVGGRVSAARKSADTAVRVAGVGVEGAHNKLRRDLSATLERHLRANAGADFEERANAIVDEAGACLFPSNPVQDALREDALEITAKITEDMTPKTRAAIVLAKVSGIAEDDENRPQILNYKLAIINRNYNETECGLEWRTGSQGTTSIQSSVENKLEVKRAIRDNPEYKKIIDDAAREWIASGKQWHPHLEPDIQRDFEAAVAKIERSQVPKRPGKS